MGRLDPSSLGGPIATSGAALTRKLEGSCRIVSAERTLERARRHFGPMGITRVANITGLDCIGIPVIMVCRPNSRSLTVSQGKGVDLESARASGVMEAIEHYHAERIDHPLKLGSWNDLRFSHVLVDVRRLPRTTASLFTPDTGLLWIQGLDLMAERPKWLPFELVHTNYVVDLPSGTGCFVLGSNGLASGNHELEAIVHGLCEVIERDAHCLFLHELAAAQEQRRLDLNSVDDPACLSLLERYRRAGVEVCVWDITSDVGVAAFRCVVFDADRGSLRALPPMEGIGCHLLREIALQRALTEAAQSRLTFIAGARDDTLRHKYDRKQYEAVAERARQRLSRPGQRSFADVPRTFNASLEGDLSALLERLQAAGIEEAVAVNLTRSEFGIPVVRVVVPGLEGHIHVDGYAQGQRATRVARAQESSS